MYTELNELAYFLLLSQKNTFSLEVDELAFQYLVVTALKFYEYKKLFQ
jgi:hypothetical protein